MMRDAYIIVTLTRLRSPERVMQPFDLTNLKTYALASRPSKVVVADLGRPVDPSAHIGDWFDSLPKQLGADELRKVRDHILRCHRDGQTSRRGHRRARHQDRLCSRI